MSTAWALSRRLRSGLRTFDSPGRRIFHGNQRIELISRQISCASLSSQSRPRVSSSQSSASCSRGNWSSSGPYTSSRVMRRLLVASTAAILSPLCYGGASGRWAARVSLSDDLEQPRGAHAAADAHGDHHVLRAAAPALDQRVAGEARARHAVGMAERDRAAVHVQLVVRDADAVAAIDHLDGEGLVQLPEVDVLHLLP